MNFRPPHRRISGICKITHIPKKNPISFFIPLKKLNKRKKKYKKPQNYTDGRAWACLLQQQ